MIRTLTAVALSASSLLVASSALAQDPPATAPPPPASAPSASSSDEASDGGAGWSGALLLGYGFNDAFKLGFGARVGYTLPMKLYIGGTFVYHLGTSTDLGGSLGSVTTNVLYPGAEVGYDISAGPVVIRPYAGLGFAIVKSSIPSFSIGGISTGGGSASSTNFAIWPGATLLYPVTPAIAVGVDARFLIVSGANAFSTFLTGQYHF